MGLVRGPDQLGGHPQAAFCDLDTALQQCLHVEQPADLVAGRDTGRGSIMFTLSWYDREPQALRERDWSDDPDYSSVGGPNSRSNMSSPPTFFRYDTISWEADPECGADPSSSSVGPSPWGAEWGTACRFNWAQYLDLYRGFKRVGAGGDRGIQLDRNLDRHALCPSQSSRQSLWYRW